jgi:geranylgeranyl diphosphate synthase type II
VLAAGGKRIRSALVLLAAESTGKTARGVLETAVAVELLHSFTLVHDDIMDNAPTRRGKPTIHTQWGIGRGILSGDVLLGLAYRSLPEAGRERLGPLFTKALLDVCEGQAVDLDFEQRKSVSLREYLEMIGNKTAALFTLSTTAGGLAGSGSTAQIAALARYGHHIGRAFQIQDDLLDAVAEEQTFGKIVGGDIVEGKKTFLLLHAFRMSSGKNRRLLRRVFQKSARSRKLVQSVIRVYEELGALKAARHWIDRETRLAREALEKLPANRGTLMLSWIANALAARRF